MSVYRSVSLFLISLAHSARIIGWSQRQPRYLTTNTMDNLYSSIGGCVVAVLLMLLFYGVSRWKGTELQKMVGLALAIQMIGCVRVC